MADEVTEIDNVGFDIVVVAVTLSSADDATIIELVEDAFDVTSIFSSLSSMLEFSLKIHSFRISYWLWIIENTLNFSVNKDIMNQYFLHVFLFTSKWK